MMPVATIQDMLRGASDGATGALVTAIWQGAVLTGAAALGLRVLPKTPAAARFAIWFTVFLLVAGLPLLALLGHPTTGVAASSHGPWLTLNSRWSDAVVGLWAAASVARGFALLIAAVRVHALWKRAIPMPGDRWLRAEAAFPGRKVQICTSEEIDRPSVIGFFSPKILVPTWLVERLSPEEMAQVILHETGHLRRADDWLNLLQKLALVVFPLNPALVWVERRLCFERELACDERVLRATGAPKAYASCLASLAEHRMSRRGMALIMGVLGRESDLRQRVLRILSRGERMRPGQARLVMGGAVLALIGGTAVLERSPQLVDFGAPGNRQQAVRAPESANPGIGGAYQAVVFHPGSLPTSSLAVPRQSSFPAKTTVPGIGSGVRNGRAVRFTTSNNRRLGDAGHVSGTPRPSELPGARWVVMTSTTTWSSDGARLIMTAVESTSGLQPAPAAGQFLRNDFDPALDAVRAHIQQVYPYEAAVPVRGGWLIIQL